jgi:tRNA dimethylallyltransferase
VTRKPTPLIAVYGPTSAGKTALSIDLALRVKRRLGLEPVVISADSRQVYRYLDIGTSKTTADEMRGVPHELIDVLEPTRKLELEEYAGLARAAIERHRQAGRLPLIVGGTGVYVASLLEDWNVEGTGSARAALERDFPRSMAADAHATLERLDPKRARGIHPNNYEAVLNALVAATTGSRDRAPAAPVTPLVLGVDRPAAEIDVRIGQTFDRQLKLGLLDEVNSLTERYQLDDEWRRRGTKSRNQVLQTHGYREFFEVAGDRGKRVADLTDSDLTEVRERVLDRIRPHTRRQRTWFDKLPRVRKVRDADRAFQLVESALGRR